MCHLGKITDISLNKEAASQNCGAALLYFFQVFRKSEKLNNFHAAIFAHDKC